MNPINNLKPWPKGVSGNPGGKAKIPEHLRGILSLTQIEVVKIISKYARMTQEQLKTELGNSKTPALELAIISVLAQSIKTGDFTRLSFLLDRSIGRVPSVQEDFNDDELEAEKEKLRKLTLKDIVRLVQDETAATEGL